MKRPFIRVISILMMSQVGFSIQRSMITIFRLVHIHRVRTVKARGRRVVNNFRQGRTRAVRLSTSKAIRRASYNARNNFRLGRLFKIQIHKVRYLFIAGRQRQRRAVTFNRLIFRDISTGPSQINIRMEVLNSILNHFLVIQVSLTRFARC